MARRSLGGSFCPALSSSNISGALLAVLASRRRGRAGVSPSARLAPASREPDPPGRRRPPSVRSRRWRRRKALPLPFAKRDRNSLARGRSLDRPRRSSKPAARSVGCRIRSCAHGRAPTRISRGSPRQSSSRNTRTSRPRDDSRPRPGARPPLGAREESATSREERSSFRDESIADHGRRADRERNEPREDLAPQAPAHERGDRFRHRIAARHDRRKRGSDAPYYGDENSSEE